jgi:hypothetical protein
MGIFRRLIAWRQRRILHKSVRTLRALDVYLRTKYTRQEIRSFWRDIAKDSASREELFIRLLE